MAMLAPLRTFSDRIELNDKFWNIAFTSMLRQTQHSVWGNWALNPHIVPGALGVLDPGTGSFQRVAMIPDPKIVTMNSPYDWTMESSSVQRTDTNVTFEGGYFDPSSGTTVTAGLEVSWKFERQGSIVSKGTAAGDSVVDDFGTLLQKQFPFVLAKAKSVGKAKDGGIVQGFGMITRVTRTLGGLNIGSLKDASTFSITGSVDGVNSMTGSGDANAGVKGSYKSISETGAFESRKWPGEANVAPKDEVAIMYEFASFDGELIIPQWVGEMSSLKVMFDNAHGGTYIVDCRVMYDLPLVKNNVKEITVWGGQQHFVDGIPLNATNLRINMHFRAGGDLFLDAATPLTSWFMGQRTIDLQGVWPWSCNAQWRVVE
jgi:hypothetical protein